MSQPKIQLPAEWYPQSAVQLTWPHADTDWCDMLDEVTACFVAIANAVCARQKLIIVAPDVALVKAQLKHLNQDNIAYYEMGTNDTWARDHGGISMFVDGKPQLLDFTFNGWGMKFGANLDNQITNQLYAKGTFAPEVVYHNLLRSVLEGGSLESDGEGTLLTTSECLLSVNRNNSTKEEMSAFLIQIFGLQQILWLDHGYLAGDDTDSHIDTLARFCDKQTIAYLACDDATDEHYEALQKMKAQLQSFRTLSGEAYQLIPLPMADAVYFEGDRIPATYANFLIINGAVLLPTYNSAKDQLALQQLQQAFPEHEIIGIDCTALIKQHGSLHCVTMQYPVEFVK